MKRIFRYHKGIMEFGLWYPRGKDFTLISHSDVDWVGCIDDKKVQVVDHSIWVVILLRGIIRNKITTQICDNKVGQGEVLLAFIPTIEQVVDIFTKS